MGHHVCIQSRSWSAHGRHRSEGSYQVNKAIAIGNEVAGLSPVQHHLISATESSDLHAVCKDPVTSRSSFCWGGMTRSALHLDGVQNLKGFRLFFVILLPPACLIVLEISVADITKRKKKNINESEVIHTDGVFLCIFLCWAVRESESR